MISIRRLHKTFNARQGKVEALRALDLEVKEGEFCVLLGPSGCGKTTTLRCVAGLERPDAGEIELDGLRVNSTNPRIFVPTEKRDIGMVFQSYAIWPHMNVFQNVAFPLTQGKKRFPKPVVAEKVHSALKRVQLEGLAERAATDLSGGQQQRVAMARAIVTEPKILLMDEPLSNLDARLREQMRIELRKITKEIGVTTLYVTHDQAEALSLGDKICLLNQGQILQVATPHELYTRPANLFAAQFVGEMNFIQGSVSGPGQVKSPLGALQVAVPEGAVLGASLTLAIRPEHVRLHIPAETPQQTVSGKITGMNYLGETILCEIQCRGVSLMAKVAGDARFFMEQSVAVELPPSRWHIFS